MHDELTKLHIMQIHVSEPQGFQKPLRQVAALLTLAANARSRTFDVWYLLVIHRSLGANGQNWT